MEGKISRRRSYLPYLEIASGRELHWLFRKRFLSRVSVQRRFRRISDAVTATTGTRDGGAGIVATYAQWLVDPSGYASPKNRRPEAEQSCSLKLLGKIPGGNNCSRVSTPCVADHSRPPCTSKMMVPASLPKLPPPKGAGTTLPSGRQKWLVPINGSSTEPSSKSAVVMPSKLANSKPPEALQRKG